MSTTRNFYIKKFFFFSHRIGLQLNFRKKDITCITSSTLLLYVKKKKKKKYQLKLKSAEEKKYFSLTFN